VTRLWIVRAGARGERELAAIAESRLLPGFTEIGDSRLYPNRDAIVAHLEQVMPNSGRNRRRNFAAQLNQFAHTIQRNDLVILPSKVTNGVAIGKVIGDYVYNAEDPCKHSRVVSWLRESVTRDTFKQDLRHSFGAFMTICEIKRNAALRRVVAVVESGTDPGALVGQQGTVSAQQPTADEDADAEDYATDIEDLANQQIISLIKSEFAGHALADLVAEILGSRDTPRRYRHPARTGVWISSQRVASSLWARIEFVFRSNLAMARPITMSFCD